MNNIITYITQNSTKLSKEKVNLLIQDREANKNEIVKSHLALVLHLAKKFSFNTGYSLEDCVSYGFEGLLRAVETYQHNKCNTSFTTFASYLIRNEMYKLNVQSNDRDIIRQPTQNKDQYFASATTFSTFYSDDDYNHLESSISNNYNPKVNNNEALIKLIRACLKKERQANIVINHLGLKDGEKISFVVMAEKEGKTHQAISNIFHTSIKKLQQNQSFVQALKLITDK